MYFRLCNSPGTFQRMMNSIFRELLHEGVLANYMDDFVIPARTMEELEERTIRFLKIAEKHNLCFKRSKCDFNMEEIPILGVIVGKGQIKNGTREDQSGKGMENTWKSKRCGEFPELCKFLQTLYPKLQSYHQTTKRVERQEGIAMGRRTPEGIWRTQGKDHKSTGTGFAKKKRKIQGRNGRVMTCNWRSTFPRARREMETHCILIKDNATSRKELRDLWQRTIGNCVVATTYHKGQMISLTSKPQKKYDVGIHKRTRQGVSS